MRDANGNKELKVSRKSARTGMNLCYRTAESNAFLAHWAQSAISGQGRWSLTIVTVTGVGYLATSAICSPVMINLLFHRLAGESGKWSGPHPGAVDHTP